MPRKMRRSPKRRVTPVTLKDFTIPEQLSFLSAWRPGDRVGRWRTWREFLGDYEAVREKLVQHFRTGVRAGCGEFFGDAVRRFVAAEGMAAVEFASSEEIRPYERAPEQDGA